jgi:hypothetical protein
VAIVLPRALLEHSVINGFPSGSPAWILLVQVLVVMLIYGRSLPFIHLEEMTGYKIPDCAGKTHLRIKHYSRKIVLALGFITMNSTRVVH